MRDTTTLVRKLTRIDSRPSFRHGLPYRWWASQPVLAVTLVVILLVGTLQ